jgi:hypothetical protein
MLIGPYNIHLKLNKKELAVASGFLVVEMAQLSKDLFQRGNLFVTLNQRVMTGYFNKMDCRGF